jgi:hypothetical protein
MGALPVYMAARRTAVERRTRIADAGGHCADGCEGIFRGKGAERAVAERAALEPGFGRNLGEPCVQLPPLILDGDRRQQHRPVGATGQPPVPSDHGPMFRSCAPQQLLVVETRPVRGVHPNDAEVPGQSAEHLVRPPRRRLHIEPSAELG